MVKIAIKGIHAIDMIRKLVGSSMPSEAEMGTIRGDFSVDDATAANRDKRAIHNIVHASENPEEAEHELNFWFAPEDIYDYKRADEDIMF
jgi:nucleoside-diphosphate kinase